MKQRYRQYSAILFVTALVLFLVGLAISYQYVRARMCYNSYFTPSSPAWCEGNVSRYDLISRHWGSAGVITGLLILITLSASSTRFIVSRRQPSSFYKAPAYLGLLSFGLLMLSIASLRLSQTRWPGNTINWRHDQAMQQLCGAILISSALLFLVTVTAGLTCAIANHRSTQ